VSQFHVHLLSRFVGFYLFSVCEKITKKNLESFFGILLR